MLLNVFVDSNDDELKNKYINAANEHNNKFFNGSKFIDAGFDLFSPLQMNYGYDKVNKLDLNVVCSAIMFTDTNKSFNTGYYMYPRSSISKTRLRLANSTGIIDAGYRGHLMGMFDVVYNNDTTDYCVKKFDRYLQICAPELVPIVVNIVDSLEDLGEQTERGQGGFGSTGH